MASVGLLRVSLKVSLFLRSGIRAPVCSLTTNTFCARPLLEGDVVISSISDAVAAGLGADFGFLPASVALFALLVLLVALNQSEKGISCQDPQHQIVGESLGILKPKAQLFSRKARRRSIWFTSAIFDSQWKIPRFFLERYIPIRFSIKWNSFCRFQINFIEFSFFFKYFQIFSFPFEIKHL